MKKHVAAFVSALALISLPAFAQAAPARDPATVEATRQLLNAMKARDMLIQSLRQADEMMPQQTRTGIIQMIQNDKTTTPEQKKAALEQAEKSMAVTAAKMHALFSDPTLVDEIMAEMVPLYADAYTVDELHQLSAFYQSPLGQKMLANMPKLMARSMEMSNRIMMPRMQKLIGEMMREITTQ